MKIKLIISLLTLILVSCDTNLFQSNDSNSDVIPEGYALIKGKLTTSHGINDSEKQNAKVYVVGQESTAVNTDNNGNFSLLVDTSIIGNLVHRNVDEDHKNYQIITTSSSENSGKKVDDIIVEDGEETTLDESIEISKNGSISGKIFLEGETDFTGIMVYIPGTSYLAMTDQAGNYSMNNIPEGIYDYIRAEKDGFNYSIKSDITVNSDMNTNVQDMLLYLSTGATGGVMINDGEDYSTSMDVILNISASENTTLMMISESDAFINSSWEKLETQKEYSFTTEGEKTIYVKFTDANGLESSTYLDSITIDTDPVVSVIYPINSISETKPVLSWTETPLPEVTYHVQLSSENNFQTIMEEQTGLDVSNYQFNTVLESQETYYWRVAIEFDDGTKGSWTEAYAFTIDLGTVNPVSPTYSTNSSSIDFSWSETAITNSKYHFQLSSDINFSDILEDIIQSELSYTYTNGLTDGYSYYWRVSVIDENDIEGEFFDTISFVFGTTYFVSASEGQIDGIGSINAPFTTINQALSRTSIDNSINRINVASGTYEEQINMLLGISMYGGYNNTFSDRSEETIITYSDWYETVITAENATSSDVIDGFTIISTMGYGIKSESSSPTISNNKIISYTGDSTGCYGIYLEASSPIISNNIIVSKAKYPHGISCHSNNGYSSDPIIKNNIIRVNSVYAGPVSIDIDMFSTPIITNNTLISDSTISYYLYGIKLTGTSPLITNNIIYLQGGNDTYGRKAIDNHGNESNISNNLFVNYVSTQGTTDNNNILVSTDDFLDNIIISETLDTNLFDGDSTDYHLKTGSLAIDTGLDVSSDIYGSVLLDLDFDSRPINSLYDIGAYEYLY